MNRHLLIIFLVAGAVILVAKPAQSCQPCRPPVEHLTFEFVSATTNGYTAPALQEQLSSAMLHLNSSDTSYVGLELYQYDFFGNAVSKLRSEVYSPGEP